MKRPHFAPVLAAVFATLLLASACQQAAAPAPPAGPAPTTAAAPAATAPSQPTPTAAAAAGPVQELKVGVGTWLSGTSAPTGIVVGRTYEMVAADIGTFNVAGKNYKWTPIVADNLATSAGGVQTANRFVNQDNVKLMYQLGTADAQAVQPIAEAAKVLYDGSSSDPAFLNPKFKYSFRAYQSPADTYPALIGWMKENQPQVKNWYILVSDDATGAAILKSSKPIIQHYGLNLVGETQYPRETTDFYPILAKVLPTKPDMLLTISGNALPMLVKQAREQGYTGKFLGSAWSPRMEEVAGAKAAEGVMAPGADLWSDQTPKALVDFAQRYKAKYGEEWSSVAMNALPTLYTFTDAMKKAGTVDDNDKIIKALETQKLETPIGTLFYGETEVNGTPHQLVLPVWVSEFKDGKLRTIATVPPEGALKAVVEVYKK